MKAKIQKSSYIKIPCMGKKKNKKTCKKVKTKDKLAYPIKGLVSLINCLQIKRKR